jgi:hypothetical protein
VKLGESEKSGIGANMGEKYYFIYPTDASVG